MAGYKSESTPPPSPSIIKASVTFLHPSRPSASLNKCCQLLQTKYATVNMRTITLLLTSIIGSHGEKVVTSRLGNFFQGEEVQFFNNEVVEFHINNIGNVQKKILDSITEKLSEEKIRKLLDKNAIDKIQFAGGYFQESGGAQLQVNALTKILSKLRHILLNIIEINTEWERVRNDQGVSPENRRKRNVPTAEIFSNLPRDEINQICVASIGGAVSDYLLESGREDTLTKFKQIFCKCISGVLRVSNVYKKKKWIKCMNCPLDPVINKYTLQVLNRHFNECLQGKFKTILAANQDEWQICRGVFGKTKEFWELDSGFYFEGQCPAVEERVINSIKTYLTSGSWSTIERQTLLPPSYIDESYGALETSNPCMESLSEIENRGNLTWDEVEELRLRKDNSYYECSSSLPRSTRSPNNVNLGQSDNEDNGAGSSTQSPIKLSKLALLKGENNKLEANDLFFFEIFINSQIREFVTLAEKLENFIFNLQNTFERAKLEREFINIKDFKFALKDNNINKIIFLNITHTP